MHWDVLGEVLLDVGAATVCGRVFLAWLPAGRVGSFAPRELCATWAASWVLGVAARDAFAALDSAFGLPEHALWIATAGLAALRLATRPAGLVPGREDPREPPSPAARLLGWAIAALFAFELADLLRDPLLRDPGGARVADAFRAAALTVLLGQALTRARRAALERRAGLFAFALLALHTQGAAGRPALLLGAGAALAVSWWRRADARALALAALAFGDAGLDPELGTGALRRAWASFALGALVLATPRASRLRVLPWVAAGLLLVLAQRCWGGELGLITPEDPLPTRMETLRKAVDMAWRTAPLQVAAAWLFTLAAAARVWIGGLGRARDPSGAIDAPGRELGGAVLALALPAAAAVLWSTEFDWTLRDASRELLPVAALVLGLVFLRPERVPS